MKTRRQARSDSTPTAAPSFLQLQQLHQNFAASTSSASGYGSEAVSSLSPSNPNSQKNSVESRNQKINELEANPPHVKGKTPLIPVLSNHSIKDFVNKQLFTRLSAQAQVALLQLLPKCDVSKTNAGGYRVLDSALTNNYFNHSCVDFKDRLMRSELQPTGFAKPRRSGAGAKSKFELIRELYAQRQISQNSGHSQDLLLPTHFKSIGSNSRKRPVSSSTANLDLLTANQNDSANSANLQNSVISASSSSPSLLAKTSPSLLANNNDSTETTTKNGCLPKLRINLAAKRIKLIIPQHETKIVTAPPVEEDAATLKISSLEESGAISMNNNNNNSELAEEKIEPAAEENFSETNATEEKRPPVVAAANGRFFDDSIRNSPSAYSEYSGLKRIQDGPRKVEDLLPESLSAPASPHVITLD